jgi:excisionase family DNA binding protein
MKMEHKKLLTYEEFGELAGLRPVTIRMWAAARKIASVKIGARAVRIPATELDRLVERGLRPALPERGR